MYNENMTMVRSIAGAPATIMIALMVTGVSMLNKDLKMWTGYSGKPIAEGLALLESLGIVQNNGRGCGWSLVGGSKQLSLFDQSRADSATADDPAKAEEVKAVLDRQDSPPRPHETETEIFRLDDGREETETEIFRLDESYPQAETEIFRLETLTEERQHRRATNTRARVFSSSSSFNPLSFDPLSFDSVEEEKEIKNKEKWLARAGIGVGSQKMKELIAAGLELEYIKAHVLEFEWHMENVRPPRLCVGTLIVRMLDGDPAPEMRCEECQEVKHECYCDRVRM